MLILAVDDDREDLDLFCDVVTEIDSTIDVMRAESGEEALDFLLTRAVTLPDFIFLDINMPRVDGRECLKAIRKEKLTKLLSVIMYSTSLSSADKALFEKLNAKFLTKASTFDQLRSSLQMILGQLHTERNEPVRLIDN
jgi:CheY-like chemotaxis protein